MIASCILINRIDKRLSISHKFIKRKTWNRIRSSMGTNVENINQYRICAKTYTPALARLISIWTLLNTHSVTLIDIYTFLLKYAKTKFLAYCFLFGAILDFFFSFQFCVFSPLCYYYFYSILTLCSGQRLR